MSGPGTNEAAGTGRTAAAAGAGAADHSASPPTPVTGPTEGVYGTLAAAAAAPAPAPDLTGAAPTAEPVSAAGQAERRADGAPREPPAPPEDREARVPPPRRRLPRIPLHLSDFVHLEPDWNSPEPEPEPEPARAAPREGRWRRTLRALRLTRSLVCRSRPGRAAPPTPPSAGAGADGPTAESRLLVSHFTELGRDGSLVQRTVHTTVDFVHRLVPDLLRIVNSPFYWGEMDRFEAERLLENKPEGTFLLRDSAQEEYLFSVSFRRYGRSLHARVEQWERRFSFDAHDPAVFAAETVTALIEHYKDAGRCMFFEPLLTRPLPRSFVFPLSHLCRAAIVDCVGYDDVARLRLPRVLRRFLMEYHYKQPVRVRRFELPEDGEAAERTRRAASAVRWGAPCQ